MPEVEVNVTWLESACRLAQTMHYSMTQKHADSKLRDYAQNVKNGGETCCLMFFKISLRSNIPRLIFAKPWPSIMMLNEPETFIDR